MLRYDVVYYNSVDLFAKEQSTFASMFRVFAPNITIVDRTDTLVTPVNVKTLKFLELPKKIIPTQSYSDVAINRAKKIYQLATARKKSIVLMYSGGIDSTAMLVAFLHAVPESDRDKITILLNEYSIAENPNFYWNHLRGKFKMETSQYFTQYLGNDKFFFVSAEGNDQLFGSAVTQKFVHQYGDDIMWEPADTKTIVELLNINLKNSYQAMSLYTRLDRVAEDAPFEIENVYEWFWWMNLALKYQCVYTRLASYTTPKNRETLSFENNYTAFFTTPEFQCWSINNRKDLIGNTWSSYKYKSKDFIFDYTKDLEYYKYKVKQGSLTKVIVQKPSCKMISVDSMGKLKFHDSLPELETFYNQENDFV
jgi:hypothetical protein